jgi:hypothetical protein
VVHVAAAVGGKADDRSRWKRCLPARMVTLSRPLCWAATSRRGTGRASANGASGTASVEVMPWPYPLSALLPAACDGGHVRLSPSATVVLAL